MTLVDENALIVRNECVGPKLYLMTLVAPQIASKVCPGQFVHLSLPGAAEHILRRPFSIYAHNARAGSIDILYRVVGAGTDILAQISTEGKSEVCASLIGPVGRGWQIPHATRRALLVGGGVGAAPLFMLCEKLVGTHVDTQVILGAQTADELVCRERYAHLLHDAKCCSTDEPYCATDDGSFGHAGFCTELVREALEKASADNAPYDYVAVCGPLPLMRIVAGLADDARVFCEVSMERNMACGIGACLSCVVDTKNGKQRACVDGPVFDAKEVVW